MMIQIPTHTGKNTLHNMPCNYTKQIQSRSLWTLKLLGLPSSSHVSVRGISLQWRHPYWLKQLNNTNNKILMLSLSPPKKKKSKLLAWLWSQLVESSSWTAITWGIIRPNSGFVVKLCPPHIRVWFWVSTLKSLVSHLWKWYGCWNLFTLAGSHKILVIMFRLKWWWLGLLFFAIKLKHEIEVYAPSMWQQSIISHQGTNLSNLRWS